MHQKITIRLDKGGASSTLETSGFKAGACLKAAAPFREILGEAQELDYKDEFYQEAVACEVHE